MAKRRNQKKEKALRNQAYARKFRKRTNSGRMNRRRTGGTSAEDDQDQEPMEQSESTGAVDM